MAQKTAIADTLKIYSIYLLWYQAKEIINNTTNAKLVRNIYNYCLEVEKINTTFQYLMAMQELEAMATPSSSKDKGEEKQPLSKPSHNNQEEAAKHLKAVTTLVDKLDSTYFTNMNTHVVLDAIPDKDCKMFLECPKETVDKVQQHTSSDNIPTGPDVINKM